MNKTSCIILSIVITVASFYGGTVYGKSKVSVRGQFTGGMMGTQRGMRAGQSGGFVNGEIISKDSTSITVKMQDGSTKIVLLSATVPVMKSATTSIIDLMVGVNVLVTGSTNSDGSVTAQNVQIRPAGVLSGGVRVNQ